MKSFRKISLATVFCWWLLILQAVFGQQTRNGSATNEVRLEFRVRYVIPEAVYFDGGAADGIRPGDKVWVRRGGKNVMQLEVKHVAQHSASCLVETGKAPTTEEHASLLAVHVDDIIVWVIPRQELLNRLRPPASTAGSLAKSSPVKQTRTASTSPKRYPSKVRTERNDLNGQISVQAFGQHDNSIQQFDFVEPSVYFRLHVGRPAGLPLRLVTRLRSSQNYRQIGMSGMQKQPPLHRVYEISLEYATPEMPLELTVGRMLRNEMRGVGYLDGVAFGYRLDEQWKVGVFGGTQPEFHHTQLRTAERKLGGFLQMKTSLGKNSELTIATAGIGRYIFQKISREYMTAEVNLDFSRQLYITQYLEIDYNRQWRRQINDHAIDLSNTYFNVSYYPGSWISFGASYDARRLVRTWETHSIADSLFDQSLRQGWRASMTLQPTALTRIALDGGWQHHKDSPDVYSAGLSASVTNLLRSGVGISTRLSYFGNSLSAGYYPALDLSRSFFGVVYLTAGGGAYIYQMQNSENQQVNPWERLRLDINLTRRFFLSGTFENFHGDIMKFVRGFVDLGWRF